MVDGNEKPVKGEDGAENIDLKARCKPAIEYDDDEDNIPLAFSRGNNKKKSGNQPKVKKEDSDGEEDEKTPKGKTQEKEGASLSKVKKDHTLSAKVKEMKKAAANSDVKASKVKREETKVWDEEEGSNKEKKKKKKKKGEVKKVVGKGSKVVATQAKDKKERKVYDLPGQKHDPPEERDPLRIFYETLHEQVPNSEMASTWMMEWGLLPLEEAKMVYQKKVKKSQQQKLGSPVKAVSVKKTSTISVRKVTKTSSQTVSKTPTSAKKRKASESETDDDDNFILSKAKKRKANESESDGDDDDFVLSKVKKRKV